LELAASRGKGLEQCHARSLLLLETLSFFEGGSETDNLILWAETRANGVVLNATPYDVSQYFQKWLEVEHRAWVFTSATLTVAGRFNNFSF